MPDVCVVAVGYVGPNGMKIVLVHSNEHEGREPFLKFPGGRRDGKEAPEATAAREVREETGLSLDEADLVHVVTLEKYGRGEKYDYHIFLAIVDSLAGIKTQYVEDDGRILEVRALDLKELAKYPVKVLPEHKPYIEELQMLAGSI